jgi:hypothetical protein
LAKKIQGGGNCSHRLHGRDGDDGAEGQNLAVAEQPRQESEIPNDQKMKNHYLR